MIPEDFQAIVDLVKHNIDSVLSTKSGDYSRNNDRLHNFKRAAIVGETTPAEALLGMKLKHDVSILDIVESHDGGQSFTTEYLMEKFGDAINYQILLLAILMEVESNA
jgi:hypothetical protein